MLIRTTGSGRKHVTVALSVAANGAMLPPLMIFEGKRPFDSEFPGPAVVEKQPKAWMDEERMIIYINKLLIPNIQKTYRAWSSGCFRPRF